MTISFPGTPTTAGVTSGTTLTLAKPSGVQDGDYLFAALSSSASDASTDYTLSGWTRADVAFAASSAAGRVYGLYYKRIPTASAEAASSYTFTRGGSSGRGAGIMFIARGVDATTPVQVKSTSYLAPVSGTSITIAALTASAAGVLLMVNRNEVVSPNADATTAQPSGASQVGFAESASGTGSTRTTVEVWQQAIAAAGSTGSKAFTWVSQSSATGDMLVLNPAAATNVPPSAGFSSTVSGLSATFTDQSTDSDGTIASRSWDFGDGTSSTATNPVHAYSAAGTYTVVLTVTDNGGATGTVSKTVTVVRPPALRIGGTEVADLLVGKSRAVAIYLGGTELRRFSRTLTEQMAGTAEIAHRGFSMSYPEMTMYAYDQAAAFGMKAIEVSVQVSSQGTFWCSHDATIDRVAVDASGAAQSGTISAMTDAQLGALYVKGSIASDNPGQSKQQFTKLADVLAKYGSKLVIWIEDKTYANQAALVAFLQSYIPPADLPERVVWKQGASGNVPSQVTAAGMKSWGYFFDSDMPNFAAWQSRFSYVGLDYNSSDATLTSAVSTAGGSRCIGHIIPSTAQRSRMLGFGMKGLMLATRTAATQGTAL